VSVFYNHHNSLWVGKLIRKTQIPLVPVKDLYFGQYEAAFDKFELEKRTFKQVQYYVPDKSAQFIGQISSMRGGLHYSNDTDHQHRIIFSKD